MCRREHEADSNKGVRRGNKCDRYTEAEAYAHTRTRVSVAEKVGDFTYHRGERAECRPAFILGRSIAPHTRY